MPRKKRTVTLSRRSYAAQKKWKQRRAESEEQRQERRERDRLRRRKVTLKLREQRQDEEEYMQRQREEDMCNQLADQHKAGKAVSGHHKKSSEVVLAARREYARRRRAAQTPEQKEARRERDKQYKRILRAKLLQERQASQNIPFNLQPDPRAIFLGGTEESLNLLRGVEEIYMKPEPREHSESCEVYVETDIKMEPLDSEDPGEEDGHSDPLEISQYLAVSLEEGHSHYQPQDNQPQDTQSKDTPHQDSQHCQEKSLNLLKGVEEIYMKPELQEHSESCEVHVETDIKKEPLYSEDPGEEDGHSDSLEISQYLAVSLEEGHSQSQDNQPQDTQPQDSQPQDNSGQDTQPQDNQSQPQNTQPQDNSDQDTQPQPQNTQPQDSSDQDTQPQPQNTQPQDNSGQDTQPQDNQPQNIQPQDSQHCKES